MARKYYLTYTINTINGSYIAVNIYFSACGCYRRNSRHINRKRKEVEVPAVVVWETRHQTLFALPVQELISLFTTNNRIFQQSRASQPKIRFPATSQLLNLLEVSGAHNYSVVLLNTLQSICVYTRRLRNVSR